MSQSNYRHGGRSLKRGLAALLATLMVAPALAAPENPYGGGTRITQRPETIDRGFHETRAVLKQFARCIVKSRSSDVRNYLLEDVGERETAKLRDKVMLPSCLQGAIGPDDVALEMIPLTLQGALAEEMLEKDGLLSQPINPGSVPPLHHWDLRPDDLPKFDAATQQRLIAENYLNRFGECVARSNPAGAYALLKSEPDSPNETASFAALMPAFEGCVEKNRTVTGDKIAIRAAVAYNYYRLAKAPPAASPTTAAKN